MSIFLDSGIKIDLAASADKAPKWHLLFPLGATKHRPDFGKITFDGKTLKAMADNYAAEGKPERAVNYFHLGPSSVVAPIDAKIASGWIKDVELREDGLYALIAWTERAREFILKDELRYLSPEFRLSATNKATGKDQGPTLLGAALLNDPFLTELPRVAASETAPTSVQEANMEKLIGLLKLAEGASQADVEKAVEALVTKAEAGVTSMAEVQGVVTKLQEQIGTLTAEKAELQKKQDEFLAEKRATEVKAFVAELVKGGKIAPAIAGDITAMGNQHGIEAIKFFEKAEIKAVDMSEKGVSGVSTPTDPKADAAKRVNAKLAELEAKGVKFAEAYAIVKSELKNDFELAYAAQ